MYVRAYVHMWWVTLRNVTQIVVTVSIGIGHMCDILDSDMRMTALFGDGDGG